MDRKKILLAGAVVLIFTVVLLCVIYRKGDGYMYNSNFVPVSSITPGTFTGPTNTVNGLNTLVADASGNISTTSTVPVGAIVMWTGTVAPTGWALCDGTNGTPDLRSRFVIGASGLGSGVQLGTTGLTSYGLGDTGGEEAHTLLMTEIPNHTHAVYNRGPDPNPNTSLMGTNAGLYDYHWAGVTNTTTATGGDTNKTNVDSKGNPLTVPHNNMPPFYALAFIMKTV